MSFMKKHILILALILTSLCAFSQRHRLASGEPYDIFFQVKPIGGIALGDFAKNNTYIYGSHFALEFQLQETKLGIGLEFGYNYCVPMAYKRPFLQTKNNWASQQVPMFLNVNYYIFNERIKPYVGLGIGTIWGRYDYSLSTEESTDEYYLRDFEGQSGWRFGLTPKVGLMISMDHRHGFGLEFSLPYQFGFNRLETQYTINLGLNYTYIID